MVLTIQHLPTAYAGDDATIPEQQTYFLDGASAEHYSEILWTIEIGSGDFDNANILHSTYLPSQEDYSFGSVQLMIHAFPIDPCSLVAEDSMTLTFESICHDAVADAGNNFQVCVPGTVELTGVAEYYSSITWETNGDGTFLNLNDLTTTYLPGPDDLSNGLVMLYLTAYAFEPCMDATDSVEITLPLSPTANAGVDQSICEDKSFISVAGTATNYTTSLWSSTGTGNFSLPTMLTTKYFPSFYDKLIGHVSIIFTATNDVCSPISDTMIVIINHKPTVYAGEDATICGNASYFNTEAFVSEADSVFWSTLGDGYFANPMLLNSEYFPGQNDNLNGSVSLCLTAFAADPCTDVTECFTLSIIPSAIIDPGNDLTVCESSEIQLTASAFNYDQITWTTSGDGTFSDPAILNPVYQPGVIDLATLSVTLTASAVSQNNCGEASGDIIITFEPIPTTFAGPDIAQCENIPIQLSGEAQNYSSVLWSTQGDGTFENSGSLSAVYLPGPADITTGDVELCLTAYPLDQCNSSSDCLMVTIIPAPSVLAGEDATICETSAVVLSGQVLNSSTVYWNTSGDGTFDDPTSLIATYFPGTQDLQFGNTSLCLNAFSGSTCENAEDCLTVTYQKMPLVEAGPDTTICSDGQLQLEAEVNNATSFTWRTDGDGTFSDVSLLNTVYFPGFQDVVTGSVNLCLDAAAQEPCEIASDCLLLAFQKPPTAFAGLDATIPEGESYTISDAHAENYEIVHWVTPNGVGYFSDENVINPTYYPSYIDWLQGSITLIVAVSPHQPCAVSADDEMILYFPLECQDATAAAGGDFTICNDENNIQLSGTATNYDEILWSTNGTGIFDNPTLLNTSYILSTADRQKTEITFYLFASAIYNCADAIDSVKVSIQPIPVANAGDDITLCQNMMVALNQATATNYSYIQWTTDGDGSFADENQINTNYYPGDEDITNRIVKITLTAYSNAPCTLNSTSGLFINIPGEITIYQDITDIEVKIGGTAEFVIGADFATNYQWYGPDGLIPEANDSVLVISNVGFNNMGDYYCQISNECGTIISNYALLSVYDEQVVHLPAGWSGISSWITPNNPGLEQLFAPFNNNLVLLKNFSGIYYPELGINTLGSWNPEKGYEIKLISADSIAFRGVKSLNRTVHMVVGWNYLPVLSSCAVSIQAAFGANPAIDIIKEIAGSEIYWPEMGINSIGELKPGKAYWLHASMTFGYTYPVCNSKSGFIPNDSRSDNPTSWNDPFYTPSTHLIAFDDQLMETFRIGDVIGAFTTEGICAGIMEITGTNNALTLFADDIYTAETDGFLENESIQFRLYRPATAEDFDLNLSFDKDFPNSNGAFVTNGISRVLKAVVNSSFQTIQDGRIIKVFPNPTKGTVKITGLEDNIKIEIYNAEGQLLATKAYFESDDSQAFSINLSDYTVGVIYLRIISQQTVVIKKIILQ